MGKKLILACMAVVALAAFALPAVASATPRLCETEGATCTTLGTGVKIHASNVGATKFISGGVTLVECTSATLTGTLTQNNAEGIKGDVETASFTGAEAGGKCKSSFGGATAVDTNIGNGVPYCLTASGATDTVSVRGNSCTAETRSITFVLTTTNIGTCRYSRAAAFTGTITTHTSSSEDAVGTLAPAGTEFTKEEGSVLCPASGGLEMKFTLTTDNSPTFTTLYIENV
jgi:hypothetical protein